jgi:2-polyprenyl-6-methoxyphenol hydroxylase-like FAD-dependent oxidoreductase
VEIAIIGAGFGGLTTALRLEQAGLKPRIYEAANVLKPLGVGIAIQPYGTRELTELDLYERFAAVSVEARESVYYNQWGQEIYGERCGKHIGYAYDQRFIHRGTLQMLLLAAVKERLGEDAVVLGARATGYEQDATGVTVHFEPRRPGAPTEVRADVVIAAEGIKSPIRTQMHPSSAESHYSGITLWRGTTLMKPYKTGGTILHVGAPSQWSLIVYPILDNADADGNTLINWVVEEMDRPEIVEDWNHPAPVDPIADWFDECDLGFLSVPDLIQRSQESYLFPMMDHDPLETWADGRVVLLGDAAHAMYPRGGNGTCQTLVDARVIAEKLTSIPEPVDALKAYEAERINIVNRIVLANRGDGPEVVRRIVEDRTGGARFEDIEDVLPFEEADSIFQEYHRLAGMQRPNQDAVGRSGYKSVFFDD